MNVHIKVTFCAVTAVGRKNSRRATSMKDRSPAAFDYLDLERHSQAECAKFFFLIFSVSTYRVQQIFFSFFLDRACSYKQHKASPISRKDQRDALLYCGQKKKLPLEAENTRLCADSFSQTCSFVSGWSIQMHEQYLLHYTSTGVTAHLYCRKSFSTIRKHSEIVKRRPD